VTTKNQTRLGMKLTMMVGGILHEQLRPVPDTDPMCFEYKSPDWDDEVVAKAAGVSVKAVAYRRIKGFGPFPSAPKEAPLPQGWTIARLDELERRVTAIEAGGRPGELPLR